MHEVIEVWVIVDSDGNTTVSLEQAECVERFNEEHSSSNPTRMVRVTLNVPKPRLVEVTATIPDEPSEAVVKVA